MQLGPLLRSLFSAALLVGVAALGTARAGETPSVPEQPGDFGPLLKRHRARYPEMQVEDCYKLLFQACLGSEHAVGDPLAATQWLQRELASMGPGPAEPLVDAISPDGGLVRVHLRAFLERKVDPVQLAQAFAKTAEGFRGSRKNLALAWEQVVKLAAAGELPFSAEVARDYGREMADAGYPAVHHSAKFKQLYRPAYRVVAREFLPGLPAER